MNTNNKMSPHILRRFLKRAIIVILIVLAAPLSPAFAAGAAFTEQTGAANPFNTVDVGSDSAPSFVDVDADGDMDAFIGEMDGNLNYYKNTGSATSPTFTLTTGAGNDPFNTVDVGSISAPSFVDVDGDGDMDAFIGAWDGTINYYQNTGTPLAPTFSEQTGGANPFNGVDVGSDSAPSFVDVDADGDMDAFIGDYSDGTIKYYQNTGTPLVAAFTEQTGAANPFNTVDVGNGSAPSFVDVDGDGDMDAFIGEWDGNINYYQNTGTPLAPAFTEQTGAANPFNTVDVGESSAPSFVDVDADGDLDAFIGELDGTLNYYQNTGTNTQTPAYLERTGSSNPFNTVDVGSVSRPTLGDVDGDGDLDAFIGEVGGTIKYYQNTGTATSPAFTEQTGASNPFNGVDVGSFSAPTLGDVDGDGDLDAFIGEYNGTIKYYQNTGTATSPAFSEQTGGSNPLNSVDVSWYSVPTLGDVDGDGDLDAFIGENDGTIKYYQNTGTATSPAFSVGTNPLNVDVGSDSAPTLGDVDGDGDLDAFIGESAGTIKYYQNTHCSFSSEGDSSLAAGDVLHFGNGDSRVTVEINTLGSLTSLTTSCTQGNHANATTGIQTGVYWTLTPNGGASGFDLDITLLFSNPDANDKVCRYTGSGQVWDCAQTSRTSTTLTRENVTTLSDWAVGDDVGPTAITQRGFSARSAGGVNGLALPLALVVVAVGGLALLWRRAGRR